MIKREDIIDSIKDRILSEHRKYGHTEHMDWAYIAAKKAYNTIETIQDLIPNTYVLGRGEVGIGFIVETGVPVIKISDLDRALPIGDTEQIKEAGESNITKLEIENLESLEVLQRAVDRCREMLLSELPTHGRADGLGF